MTTFEQGRRDLRRAVKGRSVRDGTMRLRLEIALLGISLVLLALANGELAATRSQAREERERSAEAKAQIERISDEIQGLILDLVTAGADTP